jgi:hypothetical protein
MCIKCDESNNINAHTLLALSQTALNLKEVPGSETQLAEVLKIIQGLAGNNDMDGNHQENPKEPSLSDFVDFLGKSLNAEVIRLEKNTTGGEQQYTFRAPRAASYETVMEMLEALCKSSGIHPNQVKII